MSHVLPQWEATFEPGDTVVAKLWPELGQGTVVAVTGPTCKKSNAMRIAQVRWPNTRKPRGHSFAALRKATS